MPDLRVYRLAFAPTLAALVVLAFSLDGLPPPVEPGPVTLAFEGGQAAAAARDVATLAPDRTPGGDGDAAAADYVRERFESLESGVVTEQEFEAEIDGDERTLRNVVLTLAGPSERTIVVIAGRDSRGGPAATSSAAATGVLIELAQQLGVADRQRTLVLASTDGASDAAQGAEELLAAMPDPDQVEAVLVVAQPGATEPAPPHLLVSSTRERSASAELVRTAEEQLGERAGAEAGLDGGFGQLARLAIPAAAGEQAAAIGAGFDAVAVSSAGEVPLPAGAGPEELDAAQLSRYGTTVLATLGALDAQPGRLAASPETYVRLSGNVVPGWAIAMLALALLVPPAALAVSTLARAGRGGERVGQARSWALAWLAPGAAALASTYVFAFVGLLPAPGAPYDPSRFALGPTEVVALVALGAGAAAVWWALGLRRVPAQPDRLTIAVACAVVALVAAVVLWLANPFLALLVVPLPHLLALHGGGRSLARRAMVPVALATLVPLAAALAHVADRLDWGTSAPWQLVLLATGGSVGPIEAASVCSVLAASVALVWASVAPQRRTRAAGGTSPAAGTIRAWEPPDHA